MIVACHFVILQRNWIAIIYQLIKNNSVLDSKPHRSERKRKSRLGSQISFRSKLSPFHLLIWNRQTVKSFPKNGNDGRWTSIINSSKFRPPWEKGDQLLDHREENKSSYPDCALVIQGLLTLSYWNRNHNHSVWPVRQLARLNTFLLNVKLLWSSESDFSKWIV